MAPNPYPIATNSSDILKTMAEYLPPADFSDVEVEHQTMEAMDIVFLPTASAPEAAAISAALGGAYFELLNFMDKYRLREAGAPMSISGSFDGSLLRFDAAIPVRGLDEKTARNSSGVQLGRTYAGPVIRVKHVGAYRRTGFRPHVAHVFDCHPVAGELRISRESRALDWFHPLLLPDTILPWYVEPLRDACIPDAAPVEREDRLGLAAIWAAAKIDLRMRWRGDPLPRTKSAPAENGEGAACKIRNP